MLTGSRTMISVKNVQTNTYARGRNTDEQEFPQRNIHADTEQAMLKCTVLSDCSWGWKIVSGTPTDKNMPRKCTYPHRGYSVGIFIYKLVLWG